VYEKRVVELVLDTKHLPQVGLNTFKVCYVTHMIVTTTSVRRVFGVVCVRGVCVRGESVELVLDPKHLPQVRSSKAVTKVQSNT
jgi:hypothetical protein